MSVSTVASGWWNNGTTPQLTAVRLIDVVLVSAAGVAVAAVRVRREAQHARVLAIAEVAQRAILPLLPARVRWVATAARYVAADEDTLIGGDFYDCYSADSLTRFVIGDVRGKGVGAVGRAARVIRAFRQGAASEPTLPQVAAAMSRYLRTPCGLRPMEPRFGWPETRRRCAVCLAAVEEVLPAKRR